MTIIINGTEANDVLNGTGEADTINGLGGDDILFGNGGDDILNGGAGNDMLGGDAGNDQMAGGPGDDRLVVYDPGDTVIELAGEGNDTVISMIDYTLPGGVYVENLELFEAAGSRNLTGNELSQTIRGNTSDNILIGGPIGTAPDVLVGGGGNDTFFVNNVGDTVSWNGGPANITINSVVDFTFPTGAPLTSSMTLIARAGIAAINLTGNELNQTIIGNDGTNKILGMAGWDVLVGGGGADMLNGGDGTDAVDYSREAGSGDVVVNLGSSTALGVGALQARDSYGSIDTLVSIEHVITGSGNDTLLGSAAADILEGGAGKDTIVAAGGDDRLVGGAGADILTGGDGLDTFSGSGAEFNGDLITDISAGERIVISDANLANFTFSLSGKTLSFSGGSVAFTNPLNGHFVANVAAEGGVQLTFVRDAQFVAFAAFDLNAVDLNWYSRFGTATSLQKYINVAFDGQAYQDAYGVQGFDGVFRGELDFLGSDFLPDANNNIIAGTVNVVAEFDRSTAAPLWYVEGVTVGAAALYNAALTPSNTDELGLIEAALSGNDIISLSPFNDRMNGFGGEDVITGGLGADNLTGGVGNDTFKDTKAGLNGDTITDFSRGDTIVLTDATFAGFTYQLSGNVLTYTGGSLTVSNLQYASLAVSQAAGGGVQIAFSSPPIVISAGPAVSISSNASVQSAQAIEMASPSQPLDQSDFLRDRPAGWHAGISHWDAMHAPEADLFALA